MTEEAQKDYGFVLKLEDPINTHAIQYHFVKPGSHVLDVGCHTGIIGEALALRKQCIVKGIDMDDTALAIAATKLDAVAKVDLEDPLWSQELRTNGFGKFDYVIFGDVLEHTRHPGAILESVKKLLSENGKIIISLPNVANLRIRMRLARGEFEYADSGILDRTHLRFFTLESARRLILDAGFEILAERHSGYSLPQKLIDTFPGLLSAGFVFLVSRNNHGK